MYNPDLYPITEQLERELTEAARPKNLPASVKLIIGTVVEYEHGVAEAEDVFMGIDLLFGHGEAEGTEAEREQERREALMAYAAVAKDICLVLINGSTGF